jgi:hypothetical protein
MIASPNTFSVPAVTITVIMANTRKFTGRPKKLPAFIAASSLAKREKSPKFNSNAAKCATISFAAFAITPMVAVVEPAGGLSGSDRLENPVCHSIQAASANITT